MSFSLHYFWWEISGDSYYCSPIIMQCLSLPLATFKVFSLCLVFSSLTWYVSMASLVFTVLGVSWPPQVCEFSSNLEIFQLLSSNIFLLQSLFSFWALFTQTFYHSIVAHGSLRLVHFFSSLFSLCASVHLSFLLPFTICY